MKVTLEFKQFDDECKMALNGQKYYLCLLDIYNYLRDLHKQDMKKSNEEIYDDFWEILEDNNINLFEIE